MRSTSPVQRLLWFLGWHDLTMEETRSPLFGNVSFREPRTIVSRNFRDEKKRFLFSIFPLLLAIIRYPLSSFFDRDPLENTIFLVFLTSNISLALSLLKFEKKLKKLLYTNLMDASQYFLISIISRRENRRNGDRIKKNRGKQNRCKVGPSCSRDKQGELGAR